MTSSAHAPFAPASVVAATSTEASTTALTADPPPDGRGFSAPRAGDQTRAFARARNRATPPRRVVWRVVRVPDGDTPAWIFAVEPPGPQARLEHSPVPPESLFEHPRHQVDTVDSITQASTCWSKMRTRRIPRVEGCQRWPGASLKSGKVDAIETRHLVPQRRG